MDQILEQVFGILRGVWRYRWTAMIVAWVVCLLAWPVILVLPSKYEAGARVFVDPSTALRPVIQGIVVFATICIILFNLVVDLLYAWIDPRIRLS